MDMLHCEREDLHVCQLLLEVGVLGQGGEPGLGVDGVVKNMHNEITLT